MIPGSSLKLVHTEPAQRCPGRYNPGLPSPGAPFAWPIRVGAAPPGLPPAFTTCAKWINGSKKSVYSQYIILYGVHV